MTDGLDALTEKEKEALRLLLAGHETKSIARELDLSVHTINDRLRHARRKLGTSSSRRAARILGEAEGALPSNPARMRIGVASPGPVADASGEGHTGSVRSRYFVWLAGGMLLMSIAIAVAIVMFLNPSGSTSEKNSLAQTAPKIITEATASAALADALAWVALVDGGDYEESWAQAGAFFRSQISPLEWTETVRPVREPLGSVRSRDFLRATQTDTLPGAPPGEYQVIEFATSYAEASATVETVVMAHQGGQWKVEGYFVRPS